MAKIDHISYGGTNYEIAPAAGDLRDIVAPEFSDQSTYVAGSYVLKNGVLYRFTAAHSGAWTGSDAVVVTVGGEVTDLKADLNKFDLELDEGEKKIYLTLNGQRIGYGVDVSNLINEGAVDVSELLIYFRANVLDSINHIKALPKNTVSHVCVTDLHYNTNKRHSAAVCNLLMDSGLFDRLIILGDITDDNTLAQYNNFIADGWSNHNGEIVFVLGNHDVRTPTAGYPTYANFYDDFLSKAPYGDPENLYYVYTDNARMIKYVVINTETLTNQASDPQLQMIREAVSDQAWTVFVIGHRNMDVLPEGITWAQSLPNTTSAALKEVIESGSATIGGYICGHQHVDIFTPVDDKFYHVTLLNDRYEVQNYYPGYSVTSRPEGTVDEQAISIISINTASLFVDVYRIGAAYSTRNWRYDYAGKSGTLPTQPNYIAVSNDILLSTLNKNNNHFFTSGEKYETSLVPQSGYEFSNAQIVKNGTDITESVLSGSDVVIPSVDGDVQINAYSYSKKDNLINWERMSSPTANGAVTIDKSLDHITWETPENTRSITFVINGVAPYQYYNIDFIPDTGFENNNGVKANVNADIKSNASITTDPELTKPSIGLTKRGIVIPDGYKTLKFALYSPGVFRVTKRTVSYDEEIFKESGIDVYTIGDTNVVFNSDGTVTVTGTPPTKFADRTNTAIFVMRNMIAGASYHVKVTSGDAKVTGAIAVYQRDDAVPGTNPTGYGGKSLNNALGKINYDAHYVNNPGTSVLGRGTMYIQLTPNTTYSISVKLDDPRSL